MGLFYLVKQEKGYRFIQFTKYFVLLFNYGVYIGLAIMYLAIFFHHTLIFIMSLIVTGVLIIVKYAMIFSLKYMNKSYMKEGKPFSLSNPISLKVYDNKKKSNK